MSPSSRPGDRRCFAELSRRELFGGVATCLAMFWGPRRAWSSDHLAPPKFLLEWGRRGDGEGEFSACVGVAIGKDDEVCTAEFRNERIQKFTPEGRFLGMFPVQPHAGGIPRAALA